MSFCTTYTYSTIILPKTNFFFPLCLRLRSFSSNFLTMMAWCSSNSFRKSSKPLALPVALGQPLIKEACQQTPKYSNWIQVMLLFHIVSSCFEVPKCQFRRTAPAGHSADNAAKQRLHGPQLEVVNYVFASQKGRSEAFVVLFVVHLRLNESEGFIPLDEARGTIITVGRNGSVIVLPCVSRPLGSLRLQQFRRAKGKGV